MSVAEPVASESNIIETLVQDPPFIKFPPFPEPPLGTTIMPFKNFKPRGIQLFLDPQQATDHVADEDGVELDALGIPTVELRVKHATDECKSNSRKKRKKKKASAVETTTAAAKKLPWYEEWKEGEHLRVTRVRYDSNVSPVDRFYQSAYDFRTGRPWPAVSTGLNNLWDHFRLFTGLLVNPSVFRKADGKKTTRAESPGLDLDGDDDYDDEDDPVMDVGDAATAGDSRPAKRQRSGDPLGDDDSDLQKLDEELREEKITIFLSDPDKAVRIFLSSYMREHGLIWVKLNLVYIPHLISFFLSFVLRNGVLREPVYQRGLKRALETIEQAKKELPLTLEVGRSIPDACNEAFRECFGRQGGVNWSTLTAESTTTTQKEDPTITVTDISNGTKTNITLPTEAQIQIKDAVEDNLDMNVSIDTPASVVSPISDVTTDDNATNWGDWGSNTWGGDPSENTWAQCGSWGGEAQEGQGTTAEADSGWNHTFNALFSFIGPSVFPLTHTTGVIECSTRRVTAVHFPPGHPKGAEQENPRSKARVEGKGWAPSADGVEAELDARFAKVILEPWGCEGGDITAPEIWGSSRGPVIDPTNPSRVLGDVGGTAARKPHNALTDSITLLVSPSFAETLELVPGLGLAAMWIEIVRQKRGTGAGDAGGVAEVDDGTPGRFWYHEDVPGIFPSYYTPRERNEEGETKI